MEIEELKKSARDRYIPLVREETGKALKEECKKCQPKNILEIGTAIGYSALLMLSSCNGHICTLEKDETRFKEAEENFNKFGVFGRVEMHLGDAQLYLEDFSKTGRKFDFIFLDGPKGQYIHYYPLIKEILSPNGILFADNVKLLGLVEHAEKVTHKNRTMTRNMTEFINVISHDEDFKTQFYTVEDGYIIAKKLR